MDKYGKYFLDAILWLEDDFCVYYLYHTLNLLGGNGIDKMNRLRLNNAYNRLKRISWDKDREDRKQHIALAAEYIRRAAMWSKSLKLSESTPFFDLAIHLNPNIRADSDLVEDILRLIKGKTSLLDMKICEWYLHWSSLSEKAVQEYNLPDMYEPLVKLYKRNGRVNVHKGFLSIGGRDLPLVNWIEKESLKEIDISDIALDRIS